MLRRGFVVAVVAGATVIGVVCASSWIERGADSGGHADETGVSIADALADTVAPALTCTPDAHFICDDFSSERFPTAAWSNVVHAASSMSVVRDKFVSPPYALRADIDGDADAIGTAHLWKVFTPTLRTLSCAFSFYPEKVTSDRSQLAELFLVSLRQEGAPDDQGRYFDVALGFREDASSLRISGSFNGDATEYQNVPGPPLNLQKWSRIHVDVSLETRAVKVTVGTTRLFDVTVTKMPSTHGGGGVAFGLSHTARETHAFFDDIVCD